MKPQKNQFGLPSIIQAFSYGLAFSPTAALAGKKRPSSAWMAGSHHRLPVRLRSSYLLIAEYGQPRALPLLRLSRWLGHFFKPGCNCLPTGAAHAPHLNQAAVAHAQPVAGHVRFYRDHPVVVVGQPRGT